MAHERGLYRRKDSRFWWINLVLSDGRRVCQSTGRVERTDAEAYVVRLKNEAIEARQQGLLGIFVWQQAVIRYLEEFADKRSLFNDRDHLKKLDPYLRSLRLDAIDMTALQPYIRDRKSKDGVSNATVNRALEVVRRILNVAHQDWRWLRGVPKIRMLKEPRRRVRFLRREEADRLITALPAHMKPIVQFALATGCRAGEIHGLEWSRVDLARKVAWLDHGTTKSGEGRGIPLNADAVAALESTRGQHRRWCFTFAGQRIHQSSTAWDNAKQRCRHRGLPLPRPEAHLGLLARAERYLLAGADGAGRLEVVRDGAALCALGSGETKFRGQSHRAATGSCESEGRAVRQKRSRERYVFATFD
jgi:integrase